jgi:hypothetical protein
MDVGLMMIFASYGWDNIADDQVWDARRGGGVGAQAHGQIRREQLRPLRISRGAFCHGEGL